MINLYRISFLICLLIYFTGCALVNGSYDDCVTDGFEDCEEFHYESGVIE